MGHSNLNPEWISLAMPAGPFGEVFALAYRKFAAQLLAEEADPQSREIALNAFVMGLRTSYGLLQQMHAAQSPQFPFETAFEQMGRALALREGEGLDG